MFTLSIDCGGSFIKSAVLDEAGTIHGSERRMATPYPLSAERFVETMAEVVASNESADRITIGMPGMIRHGVVMHTPHYINEAGPFTRRDPQLVSSWKSFDVQRAVVAATGKPTIVMNDAEVHAAGVINGSGLEVVFTLGTGLGSAMFDGGVLAPHLELSHATVRSGVWYDHWIGEEERQRIGNALWNRRIRLMVERWRPVFLWDRLYIGGGNSRLVTDATRSRLGEDVVIVANNSALFGGKRLWDFAARS
ncbi:MAG: hypothetical protein RL441_1441 [Actinomycetota bacterium]|jgi:polyphosphate glucokinase